MRPAMFKVDDNACTTAPMIVSIVTWIGGCALKMTSRVNSVLLESSFAEREV